MNRAGLSKALRWALLRFSCGIRGDERDGKGHGGGRGGPAAEGTDAAITDAAGTATAGNATADGTATAEGIAA